MFELRRSEIRREVRLCEMQTEVCRYCEERMFDHYEERMCAFCDENYCRVCTRYISEGTHGLCRSCLATAAELYIEQMQK